MCISSFLFSFGGHAAQRSTHHLQASRAQQGKACQGHARVSQRPVSSHQLPNNSNSIPGNVWVCTYQHRFFNNSLRNQHTVKGVFVMSRQVFQCQHVCQCNRQYLDIIDLSLSFDNLSQGQSQPQFSQLKFDLHFPNADHAEQQNILLILAECQRLGRKFGRLTIPPDKRMRVQ